MRKLLSGCAALALLLPCAVRADGPAMADAARADPARAEAMSAVLPHLVDAPKVEAPKTEPAKADAPRVDAPKVDAPKVDAPKRPPSPVAGPRAADFGKERPSVDARHVADWIADSGNNAGADFVIVDKKQARIYVFDADARLRGATPVLLGGARGDHTAPGVGAKPLAKVRAEEKTTPAGRFLGERGRNARGEDVVWVDYDAGVSMHRVLTTNPRERRLERLATPTVQDNRISYGCINVPVLFYEAYIRPTFAARRAPVYVLPEVMPLRQVFGSYDVAARRVALKGDEGME